MIADALRSSVIDLTRAMVRIPSVLGDEGEMARFVADRMRALGFDSVEIDRCGNAVGVVDGARPGPTLLFDAHVDTVDVPPREAWTRDPFGGEIDGDRIHGRGSSDMKGALAAMLVAAASLDRAALAGRLVVSASVGEESIEGAALREVMRARPPDFVLIGEATELNLARAGRGRAEFAIRTQGRPAHASSPERGVNAVHKMMRVIERIEALPMPSDPIAGRGVMALTDIISDPYPAHSVVPSGCRATYERRLVPGETREEVTAQLVEAFLAADAPETRIDLATADYTTYAGVEWSEPKWFPPWMLDADHPWLLRSSAALRAAGLAPELRSYQFCTNAAYSAGVAGVPTLGFGPSSEAHAHVVDEFVEIEQLLGAARGYRAIAAATLE